MKKVIIAIIIILVVGGVGIFVFKGVNKNDEDTTKTQENQSGKVYDNNFTLTYMDANITPGRSFNAKSIAAEATKSIIPSCALEGEDAVYTYEDIEITANVKDGKETIYSVYFLNENAKTNEGVKISDSKSKMEDAYGTDYINDVSLYTYVAKSGDFQINFQVEDAVITGIEYVQILK